MTAEEYYEKGRALYEEKQYEEALEAFEQAIALDKKYASPWNGKGNVYCQLKSYEAALACFDRAIVLDKKYASPWNGKGNVYCQLKSYEDALVYYDYAIMLDENIAVFWYGKGNIHQVLRAYEEALASYNRAIALDENVAAFWHGKGSVCSELKSYKEALACFDRAIMLDGSFAPPWHGKGDVSSKLGFYEEALAHYEKAISIDENEATPWNGRGITYYNLESYEKALACFDRAIILDESFAPPWHGRGNVYSELGTYEEALVCYDNAIALDKNFAPPWNGKGKVYFELANYELSKSCIIRSFHLENDITSYNNTLLIFSKCSTSPFYAYRLINGFLNPEHVKEQKQLIEYTFQQCQYLQAYIGWLQLAGKKESIESWEWQEGLALINYFMGDPVVSLQTYKEVLKHRPKDLRAWYYLIQSCYCFFEPEEEYMNQALTIAEDYCSEPLGGSKKNEKFSDYDLQQRYYAGLLFYLDNDFFDHALTCFQSIEESYLPAAYMSFLLQFELAINPPEKLLRHILEQEQLLVGTGKGFSSGILSQELNLDLDDFWSPFYRYAHYIECIEGISRVYSSKELRKLQDSTDFHFVSPGEAKNFWDAWTLSRESWQRIFQRAREYHLKGLTEEIFQSRSLALKKEVEKVQASPEETEEHIRQQHSEDLLDAYEKLKQENSSERREQRLGNMITKWALAKPEPYHTLTSVFLIEGGLTEKQKVFLDFYVRIQHYARQKPSDILFAGGKDIFKEVIGKGIDLLSTAADFSGAVVTLFLKPFIKATLSELIIKYLKSGAPPFKTYDNFKKGFELFIGEEKDGLGEQFEKRYPMWGLEGWLE